MVSASGVIVSASGVIVGDGDGEEEEVESGGHEFGRLGVSLASAEVLIVRCAVDGRGVALYGDTFVLCVFVEFQQFLPIPALN